MKSKEELNKFIIDRINRKPVQSSPLLERLRNIVVSKKSKLAK